MTKSLVREKLVKMWNFFQVKLPANCRKLSGRKQKNVIKMQNFVKISKSTLSPVQTPVQRNILQFPLSSKQFAACNKTIRNAGGSVLGRHTRRFLPPPVQGPRHTLNQLQPKPASTSGVPGIIDPLVSSGPRGMQLHFELNRRDWGYFLSKVAFRTADQTLLGIAS